MKTLFKDPCWLWPCHLWSLGLGSGCLPFMPGTWGSAMAFPLYWGLAFLPLPLYAGLWVFLLLISVFCSHVTAEALGQKDPSCIVCDEIVAMLLVLPFCTPSLVGYALGFTCFRLFDITKPWPICKVDGCSSRTYQGALIVLDDVAAAFFAIALLILVQRLAVFF